MTTGNYFLPTLKGLPVIGKQTNGGMSDTATSGPWRGFSRLYRTGGSAGASGMNGARGNPAGATGRGSAGDYGAGYSNTFGANGPGIQPPNGGNRTGNGAGWAPPNQDPHRYIPGQGGYPILPYEPKSGLGLSGYHGAVWYPLPPTGTTNRTAFRP